jgi:hypothetical protein
MGSFFSTEKEEKNIIFNYNNTPAVEPNDNTTTIYIWKDKSNINTETKKYKEISGLVDSDGNSTYTIDIKYTININVDFELLSIKSNSNTYNLKKKLFEQLINNIKIITFDIKGNEKDTIIDNKINKIKKKYKWLPKPKDLDKEIYAVYTLLKNNCKIIFNLDNDNYIYGETKKNVYDTISSKRDIFFHKNGDPLYQMKYIKLGDRKFIDLKQKGGGLINHVIRENKTKQKQKILKKNTKKNTKKKNIKHTKKKNIKHIKKNTIKHIKKNTKKNIKHIKKIL